MEQANNLVMSMLQTIASQSAALPKNASKSDSDESGSFQKLLDEKAQGKDSMTEDQPKARTTAAKKTEKVPTQKKNEDPVEASKQMQVCMVPLTPEELSQYPAEWLPQVQEGEPIVCIGVRTGENGESIPILAGADEAARMFGREVVPQVIDVRDPEADAILEATAPGVELDPAAMLEEAMTGEISQVSRQVMEEIRPKVEAEVQAQTEPQSQNQEQDDDSLVEVVDAEQAPQRIFRDVEAAPVKVGETELPRQTDEVDVVRQVETQIAQAIQQGESTVSVKINPENLGEVTVQVSMKSDGIMAVAISTRNDDTRALLERHTANLQSLLASRVRETVEVSVQRQQESQQNQNQQQNYDGRNGHAQDGQRERRQQREHSSSQDFMQQLRLGLIPTDGEF